MHHNTNSIGYACRKFYEHMYIVMTIKRRISRCPLNNGLNGLNNGHRVIVDSFVSQTGNQLCTNEGSLSIPIGV